MACEPLVTDDGGGPGGPVDCSPFRELAFSAVVRVPSF